MEYRIAEIAQQQGYRTPSELARQCNVSEAIVIDLWHNRRKNTQTGTLERIARTLQVSVADLLNEDNTQK
jgi:DNA-binding Xre family transcriptional regulator